MHVGRVRFVTVKVTLWFQHIPLCFHGYACDCAWCMRDSNDQIIYNAAVVLQFYMIRGEKCSYSRQNVSAWLLRGYIIEIQGFI